MPCFLCSSPESPLICHLCQGVQACSENHLNAHYSLKSLVSLDQPSCTTFVVDKRPGVGKVLLASKSIPAGDVIFIERPAVVGPDSKSYPVCVNCLKNTLSKGEGKFCSKCGFPVCDTGCENGENHVKECEELIPCKSSGIVFTPNKTSFPYSAIFPLRVLKLKTERPEVWKRVDLLMDHVEDLENDMRALYEKTVDFILNTCKVTKYTSEEIFRALGIFRTNGVNQGLSQGFGLYPTFSFLSHSCFPNGRYQISTDQSLILRAVRDISEGEEITISYLPLYQATFRRRMKIKNNWLFDCLCKRCKDPTEFGSFLGGVKCKECSEGVVLPLDSTDPKSSWSCTQCSLTTNYSSIANVVCVFENNAELFLDEDPSSIETKIDSWTDVLHPNHYIIFLLRRRLLDMLCSCEAFESRADLEKIILLGRSILKTIDIIEPGLSTTRGRLLKQLNKPSLLLSKMDLQEGLIDSKEFLLRTKDIIKNIKIAIRCFEDFGLHDDLEKRHQEKLVETVSKLSNEHKE